MVSATASHFVPLLVFNQKNGAIKSDITSNSYTLNVFFFSWYFYFLCCTYSNHMLQKGHKIMIGQ